MHQLNLSKLLQSTSSDKIHIWN